MTVASRPVLPSVVINEPVPQRTLLSPPVIVPLGVRDKGVIVPVERDSNSTEKFPLGYLDLATKALFSEGFSEPSTREPSSPMAKLTMAEILKRKKQATQAKNGAISGGSTPPPKIKKVQSHCGRWKWWWQLDCYGRERCPLWWGRWICSSGSCHWCCRPGFPSAFYELTSQV